MAVMAVVGYAAARGLALGGTHLRSFMMIVMFSNTGNYGLPVVRFAFGPQALTDATVKTSMMEARFLAGSPELFQEFHARYMKKVVLGFRVS